ncbi:MAG: hypothetical protein UZ22_OP11002000600 [Microgenomates bacterium OLB23]|nr:MAG: hypothetical protein UZ22_OP11002000600 [Microgenomates bacterium OLB23]
MGYVVAALGVVGLILMYRKYKAEALYFSIWFIGAYLSISMVARVLFPRYVLSLGGLLLIPAAYCITQLKSTLQRSIVFIAIVLSVVYFNYTIMFDYARIPFPAIDRGQYLEAWPAGWGAKEIILMAREMSYKKPVLIVAEGNFGMSHDVLDTFLLPGDAITIKPYWPLEKPQLELHQKDIDAYEVLVVFAHRREFPLDWPIELVAAYDKPGDVSELSVYRLLPGTTFPPQR